MKDCRNPNCSRHSEREPDYAFWVIFAGAVALNVLVWAVTR